MLVSVGLTAGDQDRRRRANPSSASLSAALQSFSVLSLSGSMTTYLLTKHYSLSFITTARTATSFLEIASTFIFPTAAAFLLRHPLRAISDPMAVLGITGVSLQVILLVPCFSAMIAVPDGASDPERAFPALTVLIFVFLGLSRLGHWTHNIAVQQVVQTRVPAQHRAEFSGVEMTFVSAAEIGRWACSAFWSRPSDFKGVAAAGLASVIVCWLLFVAWLRKMKRKASVAVATGHARSD
jgi:solute carrier family 40 (iron-regulated transporter), member 1